MPINVETQKCFCIGVYICIFNKHVLHAQVGIQIHIHYLVIIKHQHIVQLFITIFDLHLFYFFENICTSHITAGPPAYGPTLKRIKRLI